MKIGMAVERNGVPVGVLTDAANVGEPDLGRNVYVFDPSMPQSQILKIRSFSDI